MRLMRSISSVIAPMRGCAPTSTWSCGAGPRSSCWRWAPTPEVVAAIHGYGGLVFNDVASARHARKCAEHGRRRDHRGFRRGGRPYGLRLAFRPRAARSANGGEGPLLLAGCIATGRAVLAAEALGADFAYIGSPFLASREANTAEAFKQMVVEGGAADVIVTKAFTGARASFLAPSLRANGLDPDLIAQRDPERVDISGEASQGKPWRDIWSAGQGIGAIKTSLPAGEWIADLARDYASAREAMGMRP